MTTRQFVTRLCIKLAVFMILMLAVVVITNSIIPIISNEVSMGQMENSDEAFVVMDIYNNLKPILSTVRIIICVCFGWALSSDINTFITFTKINKEN